MVDDIRLSRVGILIRQRKYAEAEQTLRQMLAQDPNNIQLLSLLAEVNLQQGKYDVARQIIDNAIGLSPDAPHLFYIKCRIALQQDKYDEAEENISEALALDPSDADYYALLANIKLSRKQYEQALEFANQALENDAENILALNTRSTALLKLNRADESFVTIEGALREDPNNAYTHANYGWSLLEKGNHKKALEHFKEALKNDPNFEYAQAGMMQAIKATNPVYRLFLRYSFWMSNLTSKYQWAVIIGFYLGFRALRGLAKSNPSLEPYLNPLIIAMAVFAFSTWIINPISNLFLRFNRYGKFLLDKKEKMSSNFVAASLVIFLGGLGLYLGLQDDRFLPVFMFGFAMMLPFSVMFSPSKHKHVLLLYAVGMGLVGLAAIVQTFITDEAFNMLSGVFILAFIAFQWVANFIMIKEDNK